MTEIRGFRFSPMSVRSLRLVVNSPQAPAALGPYNQGVLVNGRLFLSGQLGIERATGELTPGGVGRQAEQALKNLQHVLVAAGCTVQDVVKTTIFLTDIEDFDLVNKVYNEFFGESRPARAAFQVEALPKGGLVEIEAVAAKNSLHVGSIYKC